MQATGAKTSDKPSPSFPPSYSARKGRISGRENKGSMLRNGLVYRHPRDWFHWMLTLSWSKLMLLMGAAYILLNVFFATLFWLDKDSILNARSGSFADAFFFSVQTMATIGYGVMSPKSTWAHILVTIECMVGIFSISTMTGIIYNRFARPTSRVMFSNYAVIAPYEGKPTLMFRAANRRGNHILQAEIHLTLARNERTLEGEPIRKLYPMRLMRSSTPFFNLTWTVRHEVDQESPLFGETPESMRASETEITVLLTGLDDVFHQTVHSRVIYGYEEILHGYRFVSMFRRDEKNRPIVDYSYFDEIEPVAN